MNRDSAFLPSLLPIGVFVAGLDYINNWALLNTLLSTLSQNGF